jgi:hypothetical protein
MADKGTAHSRGERCRTVLALRVLAAIVDLHFHDLPVVNIRTKRLLYSFDVSA